MTTQNDLFREIFEALQEQRRRLAGTEIKGKIPEGGVDAAAKKIRVVIGKNPEGEDVLSPWVPVKQAAGALKLHSLPSVGQTMVIRSETGDVEQGVAEPFHWSEDNPSPSDKGDEHVLTFGAVTATIKADGIYLDVGGTTFKFSASGLAQEGGEITHNGKHIDDSHVHGGVVPGGGQSSVPAN